jgi:hypothetical protein
VQSTPVCNGTVHLLDQYNGGEAQVIVLSHNGTVVEFTTVMRNMNQVYNATFNLINSDGPFKLSHEISKLCV